MVKSYVQSFTFVDGLIHGIDLNSLGSAFLNRAKLTWVLCELD